MENLGYNNTKVYIDKLSLGEIKYGKASSLDFKHYATCSYAYDYLTNKGKAFVREHMKDKIRENHAGEKIIFDSMTTALGKWMMRYNIS